MNASRTSKRFSSWETVRYELLNMRICDMGLTVAGSPLMPFVKQLYRELGAKGLKFRPEVYLTDSWGCPDRVPVIGVPFYLADERLGRIEEEQTGEVEDSRMALMLLRHEAAHAYNYAYRLWERREWAEVFGPFSKPYRDAFHPQPTSRNFVRHIFASQYGPTYAQKHPDEDFAETFAVWLTPRSGWKRKYRYWPALRKLLCVDRWMRSLKAAPSLVQGGELYKPVGELRMLLADHYGERAERYRAAAQGYVDDRLREIAAPVTNGHSVALAAVLRTHKQRLMDRMVRWSALREEDAAAILAKLEERADTLNLRFPRRRQASRLMDLSAMATALAMDFAYTGQLQG